MTAKNDAPVRAPTRRRPAGRGWLLAGGTALLVLAWAAAILTVPGLRFVILAPRAKTGFEVSVALLSLFVALVLALFPEETERERLRWVALGFAVLGFSGLAFGYLLPLATGNDDLQRGMYGSLLVRSVAILAVVVGLVPAHPPSLTRRIVPVFAAFAAGLGAFVVVAVDWLPLLVRVADLESAAASSVAIQDGLTAWHWSLSAVPLALALAAAVGAARQAAGRPFESWLVVSMVLMAGTLLHNLFWPAAYSPILTTASVLRLAFTVVLALGAVFALRRMAVDQAALLAAEADLARRRADFAAMVAHELASPVTAIRGYAAMLATGALDHETQVEAGTAIRAESELLDTLIGDVRVAAAIECEDFAIHPCQLPLGPLLVDAAAFARTLPGEHPVDCVIAAKERVLADPERIAQVLRNLLGNAAKHTPHGTPVALHAERRCDRVRVMVADRGPGVGPEEAGRVFEKFVRGREARNARLSGSGLGLYLSRRIVRAHGGEMGMEPTPGGGATFWFELLVAR